MAKPVLPLSPIKCQNFKYRHNGPHRLFDGGGLYLEARDNGTRLWRLKFRLHGKERLLALGVYPQVSLSQARTLRDENKRLISAGIDPLQHRKAERVAQQHAAANTFGHVATEWMQANGNAWSKGHASKVRLRLEGNVIPAIGKRPIAEIKPVELLAVLRQIEKREAYDLAKRVRQHCSQIFRYAIATARAEHDPSAPLLGSIGHHIKRNFASIEDPAVLRQLLQAVASYSGTLQTKLAVELSAMLFCRPNEIRAMEWPEIRWELVEWHIPPERRKLRTDKKRSNRTPTHVIPLPSQAIALLRQLETLTGGGRFAFGRDRNAKVPMSENTVTGALRRMGFDGTIICAHGFRHTASTMLNEARQWDKDTIERQLSHGSDDQIRDAYNKAKYFEERMQMMQSWADYLDYLKKSKGTPLSLRDYCKLHARNAAKSVTISKPIQSPT